MKSRPRRGYGDSWKQDSKDYKKKDGGACVRCGSTENLQSHHIIPLSKGGPNSRINVITLCGRCHGSQHRHMATPSRPKVHKFGSYKQPGKSKRY